MKDNEKRELRRRFASQHGVVSRGELRALGVDSRMELTRVRSGEWIRVGKHVIATADHAATEEQTLLAACFEAGPAASASHQSAVWLWGLAGPPRRHSIVVPRLCCPVVPWVDVHRTSDPPSDYHQVRGIPVTNPLRTLVDLASASGVDDLNAAIDRALASQLVTAEGLAAELERLGRKGRSGTGRLRRELRRRGVTGVPHPSVLESRFVRLLRTNRIDPVSLEVRCGPEGRYRVDAVVSAGIAVEVDGHAYHHTPEQKAEDERRRNGLRLGGLFLLTFTWRDVVYDGRRVVTEIREAIRQSQQTSQSRENWPGA